MSCSQVRRELLEHFRFDEELGPRSMPQLAHLESCAECRQEVGIDRELVRHLRRALRERVEGSAPSAASWELVRRRTVERPVRSWTVRVLRWGGMLPAAVAGLMVFAIATTSQPGHLPGTQAPMLVASAARRAVPPVEEAAGWQPAQSNNDRAPQTDAPLPGWPVRPKTVEEVATSFGEMPPIPGRMR
jgi:anti-sigma factor RsiW